MWEAIEERVRENEAEDPQTFRRQAWEVLRNASLRPGAGATKKMVAFSFGRATAFCGKCRRHTISSCTVAGNPSWRRKGSRHSRARMSKA